jgi:hypothetical protein
MPAGHRRGLSNGVKIGLAVAAVLAVLLIAVIMFNAPWRSGEKTATGPRSAALTGAERRFLAEMDGPHVQMLQRESASDVLAVGHATCDALNGGATLDQAVRQVRSTHQLEYQEDVLTAANYAPVFLCPEARRTR